MKKLVMVLILLAAAGGGAYYYYTYGQVKEKPQVVQTAVSQGDIVEQVQATGTLEALRTVQVGSQVSGTVKALNADFNSIVTAGKLIAELDPALLQVQVDLQQANVERQKGEIASQEVQLEDAQVQLKRTQTMVEKGLSNQQQLDQAVLTVKTRTTALDAAKKQLITNTANLDQAKLNVSYTKIYSPIDGVVVDRRVDIGQTVQASMTTPQFFTIATDLRKLKLTASVDEAEIGKIQRGMTVLFSVDSYPNTTFRGEVDAVRLNATTSNNVVTYPVWINADNPDLKLRPSMTATVRIVISTASGVTRIPNQALRFRPTSDMYTALGLTPPAPGQGRALAAGPAGAGPAGAGAPGAAGPTAGPAGASRQNAAPGAAPADAAAGGQRRQRAQGGDQTAGGNGGGQMRAPGAGGQGQPGQAGAQGRGGQGGGQNAGGQGFGAGQGRGGRFADMTPEQQAAMRAQFAAGGGRGGQGGGRGGQGGGQGAGQGRGGRSAMPANQGVAQVPLNADKIDDLFTPVQTRITNGQVWTWDEATKKLEAIRISTGATDGTFSQLISGDVKVGQQIVTNIVVPLTAAQRSAQQQSIFGQQQRGGGPGGFGGPQPGGGGGGGGAPRGGGGGGGRGGF